MVEQDRRRHPRVPAQVGVAYDNDVMLTEAKIKDISLGGASILTPAPLPVGSQLSVWFRGEDSSLDVKGRVVRVTEEDPDDESAHPGMAIQFTEVSPHTESTLQQWIDWYSAQPLATTPTQEVPALPRVEEASEQRYIQTQILPTLEPEPAPQAPVIEVPDLTPVSTPIVEHPSDATIQAVAVETPQELEATQLEVEPEPEAEVNPFATPTGEEALQTVRISVADLEAKRAARHIDPVQETIRMHPEELSALREAAQEAHSDNTVTLPEMPAYNPDADAEAAPSDSGERKSRRKKKK